MGLEEKFNKVEFNEQGIDVYKCVEIAENFAISFVEWKDTNQIDHLRLTTNELLEIYKKTL